VSRVSGGRARARAWSPPRRARNLRPPLSPPGGLPARQARALGPRRPEAPERRPRSRGRACGRRDGVRVDPGAAQLGGDLGVRGQHVRHQRRDAWGLDRRRGCEVQGLGVWGAGFRCLGAQGSGILGGDTGQGSAQGATSRGLGEVAAPRAASREPRGARCDAPHPPTQHTQNAHRRRPRAPRARGRSPGAPPARLWRGSGARPLATARTATCPGGWGVGVWGLGLGFRVWEGRGRGLRCAQQTQGVGAEYG
jgi:hypothetical protein